MKFHGFFNTAYQWMITYGPKIIVAVIIFIVGQWMIKLLRKWMERFFKAARFNPVRPFLRGIMGVVMQTLLVLAMMQVLGIQMTIFAAVIASFGVAAGFALSGTLQNFVSGILILVLKPYRIGDNIVTQGMEGKVSAIQLFHTVVTSFDNKTVIIPNSKLSNEIIVNLSRQGQRRIDIELKFHYGIDFGQVRDLINAALHASENLLASPASRIGVLQLDNDGYRVIINVWVTVHGFLDVKMQLQEKILQQLTVSGIKLPGM